MTIKILALSVLAVSLSACATSQPASFRYVYNGYYMVGDKNCAYTEKHPTDDSQILCFDRSKKFTRYASRVTAEQASAYHRSQYEIQAQQRAEQAARSAENDAWLDSIQRNGQAMLNNSVTAAQQSMNWTPPGVGSYQRPDGVWVYCRQATDMIISCR